MENLDFGRRKLMQALTTITVGTILPKELMARESTVQEYRKAIHVPNRGGQQGKITDGDIAFELDSSQTSNHLGITEGTLPVGFLGAPPHSHKGFEEICRVTQGILTIMVGDELLEVRQATGT